MILWNEQNKTRVGIITDRELFFWSGIWQQKNRRCRARVSMKWRVSTAYLSRGYKHKHRFSGFVIEVQV